METKYFRWNVSLVVFFLAKRPIWFSAPACCFGPPTAWNAILGSSPLNLIVMGNDVGHQISFSYYGSEIEVLGPQEPPWISWQQVTLVTTLVLSLFAYLVSYNRSVFLKQCWASLMISFLGLYFFIITTALVSENCVNSSLYKACGHSQQTKEIKIFQTWMNLQRKPYSELYKRNGHTTIFTIIHWNNLSSICKRNNWQDQ